MVSSNTPAEGGGLYDSRPRLRALTSPHDLKNLTIDQLDELSKEVRDTIIEVASTNGGHLASPLGAVEMTVALHYVFDAAVDKIIFDVGHQAHAHKILTDRKDRFHTLRRKGGICGYPARWESEYDVFGTGHSSTSISAALGMAVARDRRGEDHHVVAVIGDGAMTGGMAFEALSNAGHLNTKLLVILNDNEMSISRNVGAFSRYLSRLITGDLYNKAKGDLKAFMEHTVGRAVTDAARRFEHGVKGMIVPGAFFEELGIRYFGPVDGNDVGTLVHCLSNLKNIDGPVLFHCVTQKGKGYPYAEVDPLKYHGVNPYDVSTGQFKRGRAPAQTPPPSFTEAFTQALIEAGERDDRIMAITAAMPTGTGLSKFEQHFPDRTFDVGICEQHAVTFGAGLATQGMRPVVAIYSTFMQRGYDQYIHDVCLQNLPVVFAIDRAGLVGEDSPTQQGAFDLSYLRAVPNVSILAPRDDVDTRLALHYALAQEGPVAFRYGRCPAPTIGDAENRDIARGEILREGGDGYLLAVGPVVGTCLHVAESLEKEGVSLGVADARWVKPLDRALIDRIAHVPIITVEENTLEGGFGSAVLEYFERQDRLAEVRVHRLGFPDKFLEHATRNEQLADVGLDFEGIRRAARQVFLPGIPEQVG
jgi:1-deoxy-D-xylulose-5-phosphate synthase